jgi:alpha-tubulin suppressor-like RCC1 family protein
MIRPFAVTIAVAVLATTFSAASGSAQARPAATHRAAAVAPLRAWGLNSSGQLGNGAKSLHELLPVKVKVPKGVTIAQVRAGCDDSVAVSSAGRVYAWGGNENGQLGDGTTITRTTPVRVKLPAGVKVSAVRAGCADNLALTTKGRVYAWGANGSGQLGDGTFRDRHRPVLVKLPKGTTVKAISSGCSVSLAVTKAGHVLAWGDNQSGELGDGTAASNRDLPVRVKLPSGVRATIIAAGCGHALAMTASGLYGWGNNSSGQLGNGTTTSTNKPVPIRFLVEGPIGRLVSLFAGGDCTLALFSKGAVLAWGGNGVGQLGDGTTQTRLSPVRVHLPTGTSAAAISLSDGTSYALTRGGRLLVWGANNLGQFGNGSLSGSDLPVAVKLPAGLTATALFSGAPAEHAFAQVRRS